MSFGPELIWGWSRFLSGYIGKKVRKAEAADNWAALSLADSSVLLLSWDARAYGVAMIDESEKKILLAASSQTPPIVAALRKHIVGAVLTDVLQQRRDRILKLTFKRVVSAGLSVTRHIILEAMERYSNLILTDGDSVTIEAAKHIHPSENRFRTVLPGFPYIMPPEYSGVELEEWLRLPDAKNITKISGFGSALLRALAPAGTALAAEYLSQFYGKELTGRFLIQKLGKYTTIFPVLLDDALPLAGDIRAAGHNTTLFPLLIRDSSSRRKHVENRINNEISRREKQCADIEELLAQNPEEIRAEAGLLMSNLWQIQHGAKDCEFTYLDEDGSSQTVSLQLDPALSPQKNAARLFAKYKKLSAARSRAAKLLNKIQLELEDLREQLAMVSLSEDNETLTLIENELGVVKSELKNSASRKREKEASPPYKRFDIGFALIFAGFSANGNRYVTFNLASPEDIWFHAHGVPGSHVILRTDSALTDDRKELALNLCASLSVWFSKARGNTRARVDYTQRKYVSAVKGSVASVTYREFKSISADPLFWKEHLSEKS